MLADAPFGAAAAVVIGVGALVVFLVAMIPGFVAGLRHHPNAVPIRAICWIVFVLGAGLLAVGVAGVADPLVTLVFSVLILIGWAVGLVWALAGKGGTEGSLPRDPNMASPGVGMKRKAVAQRPAGYAGAKSLTMPEDRK
jgi:hypothetical protein